MLNVVLASLLVSLLGCDRLKVDSSRVSLQVPKTLSGKLNSTAATLSLQHVVVQITAPDLTSPITMIQSSKDNSAGITSEIALDVPSGAGRLIQVLAAYSDGLSDHASFIYYGDTAKELIGSSMAVDVPINRLGSSTTPLEEARIKGRYLTSNNSGPSGELKMVYRPAGKPAMIVDRKMIVGGWFEVGVFLDIPMDYVLPDGSFLGQQWTLTSLQPSASLIRIHMPANERREWNSTGTSWRSQSERSEFLGFFASSADLLTDKKICVRAHTQYGGSLFMGNNYFGQNLLRAVPIRYFPQGTTPQITTNFASIIGGVDMNSCSSLIPADEFVTHLKVYPDSMDNQVYNDISRLAGLYDLWAGFNPYTNTSPGMQFYRFISNISGDLTSPYLEAHLLPGVTSGISTYQIYARTYNTTMPMYDYHDTRCESQHLSKEGWQLVKTNTLPALTNNVLKLRQSDLGFTLSNDKNYLLCLSKNDLPLGNPVEFNNYTFSSTPATSINLSMNSYLGQNSSPSTGECRSFSINLGSSGTTTGGIYNPAPLDILVGATDSYNNTAAILHAKPDCSDTPASTLTTSVARGSLSSTGYFKVNTVGNFNISAVFNSAGLSTNGVVSFFVETPPSYVSDLQLGLLSNDHYLNTYGFKLYPQGCFPLRLMALDYGRLSQATGTASLSWFRLDGTTSYALPTGMRLVNNCAARTPISNSLSFNSSSFSDFAIEVADTTIERAILKIEGFGLTKQVILNLSPVVDHLNFSLPAGSVANPQIDTCQAVTVTAYSKDGVPMTVPSSEKVIFNLGALATDNNYSNVSLHTFTDSLCYFSSSLFEIAGGASSTTVYIKAQSTTPAYLSYYSESTFATPNYNYDQSHRLLISPVPVPLMVAASSSMQANTSASFNISGGVPPYTATVTMGEASVSVSGSYYGGYLMVNTTSQTGNLSILVTDSKGEVFTVNMNIY